MANQWFRLYSEFATDPKVQMMSESDQRRLTMLFCLRCNGSVTLQDKEVTFMLRISNDEWQVTKDIFIENGFIDSNNEILNWDKRQFVSDSSAARVAKHRAAKKEQVKKSNVTVTTPEQNRTDTDTELKDLSLSVKKPAEKKPSEKKTAILEIFEFWKETMNHKGAQLDADREKHINNAIKAGYSTDQLKAAILGCSVTPHNCGVNETGKRYDGLGVIFRNADNIDRFIQNSIHPVPPVKTGGEFVGERQRKVLN